MNFEKSSMPTIKNEEDNEQIQEDQVKKLSQYVTKDLPKDFLDNLEGDWSIPKKEGLSETQSKQREMNWLLARIKNQLDKVTLYDDDKTVEWEEAGRMLKHVKDLLDDDSGGFVDENEDVQKLIVDKINNLWIYEGGEEAFKNYMEKKKDLIESDDEVQKKQAEEITENKENVEPFKHPELASNFKDNFYKEQEEIKSYSQKHESCKQIKIRLGVFLTDSDSLLELAATSAEENNNVTASLNLIKKAWGRIKENPTFQKLEDNIQLPELQNFDQDQLQSIEQNEAEKYLKEINYKNYKKLNEFRNSVESLNKSLIYVMEKLIAPLLKSLFEGALMRKEDNPIGSKIMSNVLVNIEKKFKDLVGVERIEVVEGQEVDWENMEPSAGGVIETSDKSKDETVKELSSPGYRFTEEAHNKIGGKSVIALAVVDVYKYNG